jgi:hypothetical protein
MNANPHEARQERRRRRRPAPGTIRQLQQVLWKALQALELELDHHGGDVTTLTRLTHAVSQASSAYLKATEVGELEARMQALEEALNG